MTENPMQDEAVKHSVPPKKRNRKRSSKALTAAMIALIVLGLILMGAGVWQVIIHNKNCQTDLYGNCVALDIAADSQHGVSEDTGQAPGSIAVPGVGMNLGLRYMKTTGSIINPLNTTDWWLDESISAGWPNYNGRIMVSAHSLPTSGPGSGPRVAGAGNTVMGWGPNITRWPVVGDQVVLNKTHVYLITEMFHEDKLKAGSDPRVVNSRSLVLMTCYRGPGFTADSENTDNFVILTRPTNEAPDQVTTPGQAVQVANPGIIDGGILADKNWVIIPAVLIVAGGFGWWRRHRRKRQLAKAAVENGA